MKLEKHHARIVAVVARRQAVLDYLADHPFTSIENVLAALGWNDDIENARRFFRSMASAHEIQRHGKPGFSTYTAIRRTTRSVDDLMDAISSGVKKAGESRIEHCARPKSTNGEYVRGPDGVTRLVNISDNKPAIKNQGGQGVARPRMVTSLELID